MQVTSPLSAAAKKQGGNDRRVSSRQKLVMRVGVLTFGQQSTFCLIRNISARGALVRLFGRMAPGSVISLRLGDEDDIGGRIIWAENGMAGVEFDSEICPAMLVRVAQKVKITRRRGAPRLLVELAAVVRTGGRVHRVTMCDLSMQGARLKAKDPIRFGDAVYLHVGGLPCLKSFVRWKSNQEFGVVFESPLPMQVLASVLG